STCPPDLVCTPLEGPLTKIRVFCSASRTSSTLRFPDSVAAAVESEDAAVREAVGDLRARLIAGGAPDHADAGIRLDGPDGRRRAAGLRGEWRRSEERRVGKECGCAVSAYG